MPDYKEFFEEVDKSVSHLNIAWNMYKSLFVNEHQLKNLDKTDLDKMLISGFNNSALSAKLFFMNMPIILTHYIILLIGKLTDPPKNKDPNKDVVSLQYLVDSCPDKTLQNELKAINDNINSNVIGIRSHRNKRVAHSDQNVIFGNQQLACVPNKDIEDTVNLMNNFIKEIYSRIYKTAYSVDTVGDGGAGALVNRPLLKLNY